MFSLDLGGLGGGGVWFGGGNHLLKQIGAIYSDSLETVPPKGMPLVIAITTMPRPKLPMLQSP